MFLAYCSHRMLVMEFVEGVFMSDYVKVAHQDPARLRQWLEENQIDPAKVGKKTYMIHQRQLMELNMFHCDLHPENIVTLRKNRIALIDFGSVNSIEKTRLRRYPMLYTALNEKDYNKTIDIFLLQCPPLPNGKDISAIKEQLVGALHRWEARTTIKKMPCHEKSVNFLL